MDNSLLTVLKVHNPWLAKPYRQGEILAGSLPDPFLARRERLELEEGRVLLVAGPRQAGKTTWIKQALFGQKDPVLVLHAEEPLVRGLCRSPALALDALEAVLEEKTVLVFEEIQHLADGPLFLKGLCDLSPRRRIVATGSSSFQFGAKTRESLAGRARRVLLYPFSLEEAAAAMPGDALPALVEEEISGIWEKLLVTGGYPGPWFDSDPEAAVTRLAESIVLRDASDFFTIEHPAAFRKLLELSAADVGNLVNLSAWASAAQVSRTAARRYLDIAAEAQVLRLVPPFAGGKRAEITGRPKVYFIDNGLRNALFGGFGPSQKRADRGALWENAVYSELLKRTGLLAQVAYWRTKNGGEVDFVINRSGELTAVEVKAAALNRPSLSRAARSFLSAYRPKRLGVINASLRLDLKAEGVPVLFRRPWEIGEILG
jgi:predicted AAA+ superfamily ATPase